MSNSSSNTVPVGVQGLDLGEVVILFRDDKLVLAVKGASEHTTLHFGPSTQVLDIHKTRVEEGGVESHTTIFTIPHSKLAAMIEEIAPAAVNASAGILQPLRPGWMLRNQIEAVVGLIPPESEFLTVMKVRKRKLMVDHEKLIARARAPEFPDELYELPDGHCFTLITCKNPREPRPIGLGFKFTDAARRPRLVWVKNRRAMAAAKRLGSLLRNAAVKYGKFHSVLEPL